MGDLDKGCIVAPDVAEFYRKAGLLAADIIAPNLLELEQFSGHRVSSVDEAVATTRELIQRGPRMVLVKHLSDTDYDPKRFEMVLITADQAWHIRRPLVIFGTHKPVGVVDLSSSLLLVNLLKGLSPQKALEHVTAAVYEVMKHTKESAEHELQVVAAQDKPRCRSIISRRRRWCKRRTILAATLIAVHCYVFLLPSRPIMRRLFSL